MPLLMLEIILLGLAIFMMARKPARRRRYNLRPVRVTPKMVLSTLASVTAQKQDLSAASSSTYRAISCHSSWVLSGITAEEGPIVVGYAHSDYTVTEIKEFIESSNSIDVGLKVEQEKANRLIRIVGSMSSSTAELNEGRPIKTRLNWLMGIGTKVSMFAYNENASDLTTGGVLDMTGTLYVKDSA